MPIYQYPDGGENDPRIETPTLPEAVEQPQSDVPRTSSGNATTTQIAEVVEILAGAYLCLLLNGGNRAIPHAEELLRDALTQLCDLGVLYGGLPPLTGVRIPSEQPFNVLAELSRVVGEKALEPAPLSVSTLLANFHLELLLLLAQ